MSRSQSRKGVHLRPEEVEDFLDGLTDHMVVVLPSTCVQAAGLEPNINDKHQPKELVRCDTTRDHDLSRKSCHSVLCLCAFGSECAADIAANTAKGRSGQPLVGVQIVL